MKELRIFVAGVASNTPMKDVIKYFRQFGKGVKIQAQLSNGTMQLNSLNYMQQGHFILQVGSTRTYDSILAADHHKLLGRTLMCRPFLTGPDLYRANNNNNKRRIILKHVASTVNQKYVKTLMEQRYGRVENIFPFKSEKSSRKQIEVVRKYLSYSIMFESQDSASMAVAEDKIKLADSLFCSAERFRVTKRRKQGCKPEASTLTSVKKNAGLTPQDSLPLITIEVQKSQKKIAIPQIYQILKTRSKSQRGFSTNDDRRNRHKSTRRTESHDRSTTTASYGGYEFSQYLISRCSLVKPTAKLYRKIREENAGYLAAFELKNAWSSKTNTKFRTARCRHGINIVENDLYQIDGVASIA